jgi:hypothetical protein
MNKLLNLMMKAGSGIFATGILFTQFVFVVDGGEKAIMFDSLFGGGVRKNVLGEGMHLKVPFVYVKNIFLII